MSYMAAPDWAQKVTVDLAVPHVASEIQSELRQHGSTTVALAWRRLSAAARKELKAWWGA